MLVISLKSLIEEAVAPSDEQFLAGHVKDPEALFSQDSIEALEARHRGPYGFLAFDPSVDKAITDYLLQGTLAADSGSRLLVLFVATEAPSPTPLSRYSLGRWLDIEVAEQPASKLLYAMFQPKKAPPLPGIAFFSSFSGDHEILYVGLSELSDANAVRGRLRSIFSKADQAWDDASGEKNDFIRNLAATLLRSDIDFERTGKVTMREWIISAYKFLGRYRADIVSIIGLGGTLIG